MPEGFSKSGKQVNGQKSRYFSPNEEDGRCIHFIMDECCSMVDRMKGCSCRELETRISANFEEDRRKPA
jgi:hypothetical protein